MDNGTPWSSASSQVMMQKHDHECVGKDESDKELQRLAIVRHEGAASYLPGFSPFTERHRGLLSDRAVSIMPGTCVSPLAFMANKSLSTICWRAWGWARGKGQSWAGWNQHHGESKRFVSALGVALTLRSSIYIHIVLWKKKKQHILQPTLLQLPGRSYYAGFPVSVSLFCDKPVTQSFRVKKKKIVYNMSATLNCQLLTGSWEWMQTFSLSEVPGFIFFTQWKY